MLSKETEVFFQAEAQRSGRPTEQGRNRACRNNTNKISQVLEILPYFLRTKRRAKLSVGVVGIFAGGGGGGGSKEGKGHSFLWYSVLISYQNYMLRVHSFSSGLPGQEGGPKIYFKEHHSHPPGEQLGQHEWCHITYKRLVRVSGKWPTKDGFPVCKEATTSQWVQRLTCCRAAWDLGFQNQSLLDLPGCTQST